MPEPGGSETAFTVELYSDAKTATFAVNGGEYDPSHPSPEANLNFQYAEVMAYPTPHIYHSIGDQAQSPGGNEPAPGNMFRVLEWLNFVLSQLNIPWTIGA